MHYMRRFSPRKPSPAMAVAFIALLAALSGTAVALPGKNTVDSGDLKKNAVKTRDIARNAVTTPKIRNGAVNSRKVRNNSLTGTDINEGSLGQVPSANSANSANTANTANTANLANNIAPPEGFHEVGAPGEPAFQNGCTKLPSAVPGVEAENPGFYKDREGVVHLKGVFDNCDPTGNSIVFNLPPGYRPANNRLIVLTAFCNASCETTDSGGDTHNEPSGLLGILGAGTGAIIPGAVTDGAVIATGDSMSLDGLSFRAGG
jgi:hypothetical protein